MNYKLDQKSLELFDNEKKLFKLNIKNNRDFKDYNISQGDIFTERELMILFDNLIKNKNFIREYFYLFKIVYIHENTNFILIDLFNYFLSFRENTNYEKTFNSFTSFLENIEKINKNLYQIKIIREIFINRYIYNFDILINTIDNFLIKNYNDLDTIIDNKYMSNVNLFKTFDFVKENNKDWKNNKIILNYLFDLISENNSICENDKYDKIDEYIEIIDILYDYEVEKESEEEKRDIKRICKLSLLEKKKDLLKLYLRLNGLEKKYTEELMKVYKQIEDLYVINDNNNDLKYEIENLINDLLEKERTYDSNSDKLIKFILDNYLKL